MESWLTNRLSLQIESLGCLQSTLGGEANNGGRICPQIPLAIY